MDYPNPDDANKLGSTPGPIAGESRLRHIIEKAKPPIIGNAGQLVVASLKYESEIDPKDQNVVHIPVNIPTTFEYFRGTLVGEVGPYVVIETPAGPKTLQRCDYDFFVKSE